MKLLDTQTIPDIISRFQGIRIFVHAVTSVGELPGINLNDDESLRALLLARSQDIVVVSSPVDTELLDYYCSLGFQIDPNRIVVVAGSKDLPLTDRLLVDISAQERLTSLVGNETIGLDTFAVCDRELDLIACLSRFLKRPVKLLGISQEVARKVNRKDTARCRAIEMGVPITPGEIIESQGLEIQADLSRIADAIRRQIVKSKSGSVVVKGAVGDSGSAIFVVPEKSNIDDILQTIAMRGDNYPYQVEPFFELNCAPNVTVWIDPENGKVYLVNVTDQRLSEKLVFSGSIFPSASQQLPDMIEVAKTLADRLYSEGVQGWVGFDFGEVKDFPSGEQKFFFSEINARYNGGLYAKAVLDTLQAAQRKKGSPQPAAYITENFSTSTIDFAQLRNRLEGLLFDPLIGRGIFPYNPGRLQDGKVALTCLGQNLDEVRQLLVTCRQRFS